MAKIISMYARGMTTREIQGHLQEIYGIEVSPTLISNVTDAVIEEVKLWQNVGLPAVIGLLRDAVLAAQIRRAQAGFTLLQDRNDLFWAVSCSFNAVLLSWARRTTF